MAPDHLFMLTITVATVIYLAWSAARLRTHMDQDRDAILAALRPLQDSSERIAQMVRDLHR